MGKKCCVETCQRKAYAGCGLTFHRFPKNADVHKKWVEVTPGRINSNSVVCSLHFNNDDFASQLISSKRHLKSTAVPSIFKTIRTDSSLSSNAISNYANYIKIKNSSKNIKADDDQGTDCESGDAGFEHDNGIDNNNDNDDDNTELHDSGDDLYSQKNKMAADTFRCKCCLEGSKLTSMWQQYSTSKHRENYGTMLIECFALPWSRPKDPKNSEDLICESCIKRLRDAVSFKTLVLASEQLLTKQMVAASLDKTNQEFDDDEDLQFDVQTEYLDYEFLEDCGDDAPGDDATPDGDEALDGYDSMYDGGVEINTKDDTALSFDHEDSEYKSNPIKVNVRKRKHSTDVIKNVKTDTIATRGVSYGTKRFKRAKGKFQDTNIGDESYNIQAGQTINKKIKGYLEDILRYSNATPIGRHTANGFHCTFCKDQYDTPKNLKQHTLMKHAENVTVITALDHIKLDITDLKCLDCKASVESLEDFVNHMQSEHRMQMRRSFHYPIVPYKFETNVMTCALCEKEFKSFVFLTKHMDLHMVNCEKLDVSTGEVWTGGDAKNGGSFKVNECFGDFNGCDEENSVGSTDEDSKARCNSCCWTFKDQAALRAHMSSYHRKLMMKCQYCDSKFLGMKDLTRHVMVKHNARTQ